MVWIYYCEEMIKYNNVYIEECNGVVMKEEMMTDNVYIIMCNE